MPYKDRQQQNRYQREWMASRRAAYFRGKSCRLCHATNNLELHHNDPLQKVSHRIWSWRQDRMLAELAKCSPICSECHKKLSGLARPRNHGSTLYSSGGCRCSICKAAKALENKRYRDKVKNLGVDGGP